MDQAEMAEIKQETLQKAMTSSNSDIVQVC